MRRICLIIGLILLLAGSSTLPAQKIVNTTSVVQGNGFGLQSMISITWGNETQKPLVPGGEPRNLTITATYYTIRTSPILGKFMLLYCQLTHKDVTATFDVGETPSWCTAFFSDSQLQFPITDEPVSQNITVTFAVTEYAPAYQLCSIPIHVSVETLKGPFGCLPFVSGYDNTATFICLPGYLPRIIITPASTIINATPGNTSILPINITNTGNARTMVHIAIIDYPSGDWLISFPGQVCLETNMSCNIILSIVPPSGFSGTENITMSYTPTMADNPTQYGEPVNLTITVICKS